MHKASYLNRSRSCALGLSGDMLDTKGLVLLTVCASYVASEFIISSNGWVPITRDNAYNPRQYNIIYGPAKAHSISGNTVKITNSPNAKDVETETNNDKTYSRTKLFKVATSIKTIDPSKSEHNEKRRNETEIPRKAKQIIVPLAHQNENSRNDNDKVIKKYDMSEENFESKPPHIADRSNTYEVEEDTYSGQDNEQDNIESFRYNYMPPAPQNVNYNSTLINILSKYNIKPDDPLQNYDLSRQRKVNNPILPEMSRNPRVLNVHRYNSLNHLPVDPLLAVFLSNYGFYVPSLYGIKSNYNNLYGYLASNNIHNNRPFGLYKIFSDTDSWN